MTPSTRLWAAISAGTIALAMVAVLSAQPARGVLSYGWGQARGGYSVADRLAQYGPAVASRLRGEFERQGLAYPPHELAYVAFKDARVLEVYARMASSDPWRFVKTYPVLAASGSPGPKLAEGDNQVPEGLYRASFLNPNSRFHLSIRLNYPNAFDKRMARADGRTRLGGDIMIHGNAVSIGCLAMGDQAAEDLFVLAALVSMERVRILVSPTDFRVNPQPALAEKPQWVRQLYAGIREQLGQFQRAPTKHSTERASQVKPGS